MKVENKTDDRVSWVEVPDKVRNPGDPAHFALCAYILPTTTTTTTTTSTTSTTTTTTTTTITTTTPSSISMGEMVDFLSPRVECPLVEKEEQEQTGETLAKNNMPAIDLLLNPARAGELDQMQKWVEERAENITLTEVT